MVGSSSPVRGRILFFLVGAVGVWQLSNYSTKDQDVRALLGQKERRTSEVFDKIKILAIMLGMMELSANGAAARCAKTRLKGLDHRSAGSNRLPAGVQPGPPHACSKGEGQAIRGRAIRDEASGKQSQSPAARELRVVLFTAGELSAIVSRPAFARSELAWEGHQ